MNGTQIVRVHRAPKDVAQEEKQQIAEPEIPTLRVAENRTDVPDPVPIEEDNEASNDARPQEPKKDIPDLDRQQSEPHQPQQHP